MRVVVAGGGIAGLSACRRIEALSPEADIVLVERDARLGGKILTERFDGFVVEGAPDSMLARKERGIVLCEELGLSGELVGRRPENAHTYVRLGEVLHPLPSGLTGMIPTDLDALAQGDLLSDDGLARLEAERELPAAPGSNDESIADFVTRRLGREAYERIIEPLMTGIYGGDGQLLSLRATFPRLRELELEHGSVLRALSEQERATGGYPPFVTLRGGMDRLVSALATSLTRTMTLLSTEATAVRRRNGVYEVQLGESEVTTADAVVVAVPAFAASELLDDLDQELADLQAEIPYGSSAVVTLAYREEDAGQPLDGYGYVVPRSEGTDVLACTWTSSKWDGRAPEGFVLVRVYAGRFGRRDVTAEPDSSLVALAREEVGRHGLSSEPVFHRVHRWPRGMPQYVLGHPERVERIDAAVARHPGLALAGAAYRGVGISDCIASGEAAAESVVRSVAGALT